MTPPRPESSGAPRPERSGAPRLGAAWRALEREQRLVVAAALALLATMLLPWYSLEAFASVGGKLEKTASAKLAITVFSWVEAAIFLVAVGVTLLVAARGGKRAFHLPGGDGTIVTAAGAWATFLIFYRFVDKPGAEGGAPVRLEYGLSWGIFFGLLAALGLVAAGLRLRAAQIAEPALPGDVAPDGGAVRARAPQTDARERAAPAGAGSSAGQADAETREQRRREREERRRSTPASAGTPVRERRSPPRATPTTGDASDEAPTQHAPPGDAPTRPFGDPPSFEPPEFQPPPRRRAPETE